jgi:hypothetical protein
MKKILLVLTLTLGTLVSNGQTVYNIDGMRTGVVKMKMNVVLSVTDSILNIKSDYKGKLSEYNLKIVSKDENIAGATYNCIGQVGTSDKHQFIIVPTQNNVLWTMINSFTNEKIEVLYSLKK